MRALRTVLRQADQAAARALRPPKAPKPKRLTGGGAPGKVKRYKPEEFADVLKSRKAE